MRNEGNGRFFAQAIREKLSNPSGAEWSAVLELESAKNQSIGLAQLLFDTLQTQAADGKQASGATLAGVADLVNQTANRLENAQAALTAIITTRRKAAELKATSAN